MTAKGVAPGAGGTTLLLIDVQKSFHPGGSLAIPEADTDAARIAKLVRQSIADPDSPSIDRIVATMDSHHKLHIAHPAFWVSGDDGKNPDPFTIITCEDVKAGKWKPHSTLKLPANESLLDADVFSSGGGKTSEIFDDDGNLDLTKYCIEYTRLLEEKGKFKLCIWPEHCLIGTDGHCVVEVVRDALDEWSEATGGSVEWVMKGQNLLTESYSVLAAEVPLTAATSFDEKLYKSLTMSDQLLVAGQALSHCVNYTIRDIVEKCPENERHKISLLTDCARSVPGFEGAGEECVKDMKSAGVRLCTSAEALA